MQENAPDLCILLAIRTKKEEIGDQLKVGDKPNFSFHHNILFANCFTLSCLLLHWKNKTKQNKAVSPKAEYIHQKQTLGASWL